MPKFQFKGREIECHPLTLGDFEKLEDIVDLQALGAQDRFTFKQMVGVLHYVLHKADPSVTIDEVRELRPDDPLIVRFPEIVGGAEPDPTSSK